MKICTQKIDFFKILDQNTPLSKLNLLFHLKSKTNLVTLRKCNSHLQYYKIDLNFSIKLHEINLYVCEEYKTKREIQTEHISKETSET